MGMYTELRFFAELNEDVPKEVIDILNYMVYDTPHNTTLPNNPFFKTERWDWMFRCDSYYFNADTHSTIRYDEIAEHWYLTVQCNLKNYTDEIGNFLDWIKPYCYSRLDHTFMGYYRYEESETPTLIYF